MSTNLQVLSEAQVSGSACLRVQVLRVQSTARPFLGSGFIVFLIYSKICIGLDNESKCCVILYVFFSTNPIPKMLGHCTNCE